MRDSESSIGRLLPSLLVAGVAALGMFATLFSVWYRSAVPKRDERLQIALEEYITGRFSLARGIAEQVGEPVLIAETENPQAPVKDARAGAVEQQVGQGEVGDAEEVKQVKVDIEKDVESYRLREFLLGAAGTQLALVEADPRKMRLALHEVLPHLEVLYPRDFPQGRSAEAKRLLGIGYSRLGQFEKAIAPLEEAISEEPSYQLELLPLLVENQFRTGGALLIEAQQGVDALLKTKDLSEELRNTAILLKSRIESGLGNFDLALSSLDEITDPMLMDEREYQRASVLIEHADAIIDDDTSSSQGSGMPLVSTEAQRKIESAIRILDDIYHRNDLVMGSAAQYLAAKAYRTIGDKVEALGLFSGLRQSGKDEAELVAAGLAELELLAELGNFSDCLQAVKIVVRELGDPQTFDPKIMGLEEFQRRLRSIPVLMWRTNAYASAKQYGELLPPIVEDDDAKAIVAETYQRWGAYFRQTAKQAKEVVDRQEQEILAREKYREAGNHYAEVARLRFTEPTYPDTLWLAIENYQLGRDFPKSLELLDHYLAYEDRVMLPKGLLAKGKALLAIGDPETALNPLLDCVEEYPRDPLGDEARLLAATALLELGETEKPREMLEENLFGGQLSPENQVFRDSLFVLSEALYRKASYEYYRLQTPSFTKVRLEPGVQPDAEMTNALEANQRVIEEAIGQLEEVIYRDNRHGNPARALRSTYLKAQAHKMAAFWPEIQAANPNTLEPSRRRFEEQVRRHLQQARSLFEDLRETFIHNQTVSGRLMPAEQAMLRNSFMGIARTLYQLGEYAAAASEYQRASQEFLNDPLALEATMGESLCYVRLGKFDDVKRLYNRAQDTLNRIPAESDGEFTQTTRYNRNEWESLITWLGRP